MEKMSARFGFGNDGIKDYLRSSGKSPGEQAHNISDRYFGLFNSISKGMCITEVVLTNEGEAYDLVFREVNPSFVKQCGMQDVTGKFLSELLPGEEKVLVDRFAEVILTGKNVEFVEYSRLLDKWFEISATSFGYPGEKLVAVIFSDVTERKVQESKLKESELKFRTIVETANEGVCLLDENLKIRYVNDKIRDITGYDPSELDGRSALKYVGNEELSKIGKNISRFKSNTGKYFEIKLTRKDHKEITLSVNATVLQDSNGNCTGYVGMIMDITDRIAIEKDLKRTKRKMQTALRNASIGTWECNLKTNELIWDRRTEEIFGIEQGAFDGTLSSLENLIHEEDVQYVTEAVKKALAGSPHFENIFRTRPVHGKCNYVLSKGNITRDRKGNPVNVSGICFDVTYMKEGTEQALIRLNEDLLRSNSDLQQFAYVASHDLQEPLRMISSFTQLLQQRYSERLDQDANDYINFAVSGSKRMYELLNGLLAYSRIQTRGREFTEVNMNAVVEKVKANIKLLIEDKNATIDCCELPVIKANENQMIQLIQNLVENAIKFSNANPVITISAVPKGELQIYSVKDNGIGIEPIYFEKIFRIFQRLHHSEYPGTGIGLAICQRIVERHGGKIWVDSKPGEGSTFSFSIPARVTLG